MTQNFLGRKGTEIKFRRHSFYDCRNREKHKGKDRNLALKKRIKEEKTKHRKL